MITIWMIVAFVFRFCAIVLQNARIYILKRTFSMDTTHHFNNKIKGIMFIILTAFCFAVMNIFVRLSGPRIPSIQKSFFRNVVALVFAFFILLKEPEGFKNPKRNLSLIIGRSLFGTIGLICNFYAVDHLIISDASLLNKLSTFYVLIFSYIFLKEKVKPYQWLCICIAFAGALLVIKPTFHNADISSSIVGFVGGVSAGMAHTFVRALTKKGESKSRIVFAFSLFSCVATLPLFIFDFVPMKINELSLLLLAGLAACGGQYCLTTAYSYAPAKEISIFDYSQIIFAAILGFMFFGEIPDLYSFIGYFVIIIAAIMMFLIDNKHVEVASNAKVACTK